MVLSMPACQQKSQLASEEELQSERKNVVVKTILSRRSIRKYQPQAVNRDTMNIVLKCGINAPNARNKQD